MISRYNKLAYLAQVLSILSHADDSSESRDLIRDGATKLCRFSAQCLAAIAEDRLPTEDLDREIRQVRSVRFGHEFQNVPASAAEVLLWEKVGGGLGFLLASGIQSEQIRHWLVVMNVADDDEAWQPVEKVA